MIINKSVAAETKWVIRILICICSGFVVSGMAAAQRAGGLVAKSGKPVETGAAPAEKTPAGLTAIDERDGQGDFDFYVGEWKLHNRRLKSILTGSTEWYEFDATSVVHKIWGGKANMDELEGEMPTGHVQGLTIRLYDPQSREWSLYWANSKSPDLATPTVGRFNKDHYGEFFDQEKFQGKTIQVRYIWSNITANSYHWEQAFSLDGGKTWETNWVTDGKRIK